MSPNSDDSKLDETIDETFPASDAPANTVETGIRTGPTASADFEVLDHPSLGRFEVRLEGHTAFLVYERSPRALTLMHTEVPKELQGRRVAEALITHAVAVARAAGLQLVVVCPFARAYFRRHPSSPSSS